MNDTILGIDLGTTNSCVYVMKKIRIQGNDGESLSYRFDACPSSKGDKTIPSYVYFSQTDKEIVVGEAARENQKTHIQNTIYDSKRILAKPYSHLKDDEKKNWTFEVIDDGDKIKIPIKYNNSNVQLNPEDISCEILKYLKQIGDTFSGNDLKKKTKAVITVPAYFHNSQRKKTILAAENANLEVIRIINEPTAAAIAYCNNKIYGMNNEESSSNKSYTYLIYDFGGGTFDVSVVKLTNNPIEITVLATGGDNHLGGQDIDNNLVKYYAKQYLELNGVDLYQSNMKKKLIRLKRECEKSKMLLTDQSETTLDCEFLEDTEVNLQLSRALLTELNQYLYDKTIEITKNVLKESRLEISKDINGIVLVGGTSRIEEIQKLLSTTFPKVPLLKDINVDEVVALGACIVGNNNNLINLKINDITCHALSTDTIDGKVVNIIDKNQRIPCKMSQMFGTYADNQTHVDVQIFEGDSEMQIENEVLGYFKLEGITPAPKGKVEIEVIYTLDVNGILKVTAKEVGTAISNDLVVSL